MTRTFIALTLSENIEKYLRDVVDSLKKADIKASWTKPGRFHITLKFLGDVTDSQIESVKKTLSKIDATFPIPFELSGISAFPNTRNPKVLWQGVECPDALRLAKQVEDSLQKIGFDKMDKSFNAHITLGRIKSSVPAEFVHRIKTLEESLEGYFSDLVFFKSELTKAGPIYTPLWEYSKRS
ncbi:MAG TPA: RNA 2',3'-cyclic phosphodiesterase [Caldisericia bacterium]|nr:RNA 2',3'-cyclic phosphodiesterase [Caldisericia bacterium]HPF48930.1 RNA 2',3'-cyclic phosphodiesterase [Caldisericia bacterium]HPI83206.1 RNA 2',3'-cyclic phosphodiesterase [Caldisericia bacterium]HPQ92433.1 RNA 2',3'-cyclic phosphodiesterase [Caldisericia bacterium]HRV74469.1 RNA 2',3'-cyclic phosphodiesterase [Caldisericia bacterium]